MQTDIQSLSFAITDGLRNHIKRRLAFALSAREEHIHRVSVRLTDVNGPKGGDDMCCHIQVVLNQLPDVVVKDTQADIYMAVDRAADRVGRTVTRQLSRKLDKKRSVDSSHKKLLNMFEEPIGDLSP